MRGWRFGIALYGFAWVVLTASIPAWLPLSLLTGVWRRRSFVVLRLSVFLWMYLSLAVLTLFQGIAIRVSVSGVGHDRAMLRLGSRYGAALLRWCVRLLSISVVVEGEEHLTPGPLVVFVRHASIVDAALPAALFVGPGILLHYVLRTTLKSEPCIDLLGSPGLHAFIDRDGPPLRELRKIRGVARELRDHAIVVYPEGTRFSEDKRLHEIEQLERFRPELAATARSMTHVLPPKLLGPLAALDATPTADCLIVAHRGLEGLATMRDFVRGDAVGRELCVRIRRTTRRSLPPRSERPRWLYARWKEVDDFVAGSSRVGTERSDRAMHIAPKSRGEQRPW